MIIYLRVAIYHENAMNKKLCSYYLDNQVTKITSDNAPKNFVTCNYRKGKYYFIAGEYVSSKNCCSEYVINMASR